jgi:TctA family transporter
MQQFMISLIMIGFFSFSEVIYSNEKFFNEKKNKMLLNHQLIKKKIKELYPKWQDSDIINELKIHR